MGLSEAHRQRIVVSVDWFPPAFRAGGPIRSTFNLVSLLANTYDVWVISGAYDLGQDRSVGCPFGYVANSRMWRRKHSGDALDPIELECQGMDPNLG